MRTGVTSSMLLQFIVMIFLNRRVWYVLFEQQVVKKLTLHDYIMQNIREHISQLQSWKRQSGKTTLWFQATVVFPYNLNLQF